MQLLSVKTVERFALAHLSSISASVRHGPAREHKTCIGYVRKNTRGYWDDLLKTTACSVITFSETPPGPFSVVYQLA